MSIKVLWYKFRMHQDLLCYRFWRLGFDSKRLTEYLKMIWATRLQCSSKKIAYCGTGFASFSDYLTHHMNMHDAAHLVSFGEPVNRSRSIRGHWEKKIWMINPDNYAKWHQRVFGKS